MTAPASRTKLTYEDYLLFPEDGKRHELMDGEHYVTPSPNTQHQRISGLLLTVLHTFSRKHRVGEVFAAPYDVVLSDTDVVEPDLLFVSSARKSIIGEAHVQGAPDLIVEILSPTTRKTDEIVKRRLYEKFGVLEYWIVDPELETIKVYRLTDGRYTRVAELAKEANDSLTTPLLPGLTLPLAEIFGSLE